MVVTLHRPSPQVPQPSLQSAIKCFDSAAFVIDISSKQMMSAAVDITWVFLLTLYMSLNTLLWCVTRYPDIRAAHSREEVQELVYIALDIIDQCVERWPGTASASELYSILTKACLQSYESNDTPNLSSPGSRNTPTPKAEPMSSPNLMDIPSAPTMSKPDAPAFNTPQFGYVFGSSLEPMDNYNNLSNPFPSHPTFRSNSIFLNPATNDHPGRRFSYFPPDFTQGDSLPSVDLSSPPSDTTAISPPFLSSPQHTQTPPSAMSSSSSSMRAGTPGTILPSNHPQSQSQPQSRSQQRPPLPPSHAAFTVPPLPPGQLPQGQRPLPQVTDWFNSPQQLPPPFISPYAFGGIGAGFWGTGTTPGAPGMNGFDGLEVGGGLESSAARGLPPERQGSLSQAQQIELMDVLENEGMADIDSYLSTTGIGFGGDAMGAGGMGMGWGGQG